MNRGGYRINAGRKSKSAELELFSKLTVYDNLAIDTLIQGVNKVIFILLSYLWNIDLVSQVNPLTQRILIVTTYLSRHQLFIILHHHYRIVKMK